MLASRRFLTLVGGVGVVELTYYVIALITLCVLGFG